MASQFKKVLGRKAYGSIGHLPNSRLGPGDHSVEDGQARICLEKTRDKHDTVIVQEKLDGSCVAVARIDGVLHPIGRAGWPAVSSRYEQHRLFHNWVFDNHQRFMDVLRDGERIVGEWLAQAHSIQYDLTDRDPFVAFDIMHEAVREKRDGTLVEESRRIPYVEFRQRLTGTIQLAPLIHCSNKPCSLDFAFDSLGYHGKYGAQDQCEGLVYRVERDGAVDFLAKYVRNDHIPGRYLPEISGCEPVWNWRPMELESIAS